jgi:hypothetical protein
MQQIRRIFADYNRKMNKKRKEPYLASPPFPFSRTENGEGESAVSRCLSRAFP